MTMREISLAGGGGLVVLLTLLQVAPIRVNPWPAIAFVVLAEAGSIDDITASEQASLFSKWAANVNYTVGQLRQYGGKLYRCVQAHTSQTGWEPPNAASLWSITSDPAEEWPARSQPLGAHDAYAAGAKVSHNSKHWTSDLDGNVWEPGVCGWTEASE